MSRRRAVPNPQNEKTKIPNYSFDVYSFVFWVYRNVFTQKCSLIFRSRMHSIRCLVFTFMINRIQELNNAILIWPFCYMQFDLKRSWLDFLRLLSFEIKALYYLSRLRVSVISILPTEFFYSYNTCWEIRWSGTFSNFCVPFSLHETSDRKQYCTCAFLVEHIWRDCMIAFTYSQKHYTINISGGNSSKKLRTDWQFVWKSLQIH